MELDQRICSLEKDEKFTKLKEHVLTQITYCLNEIRKKDLEVAHKKAALMPTDAAC